MCAQMPVAHYQTLKKKKGTWSTSEAEQDIFWPQRLEWERLKNLHFLKFNHLLLVTSFPLAKAKTLRGEKPAVADRATFHRQIYTLFLAYVALVYLHLWPNTDIRMVSP